MIEIMMRDLLLHLLIISINTVTNASSNSSLAYLTAHRFLFISGWPQSGTSLMQQIFTVAPQTSTMVQKCSDIIPSGKCLDWNFEGQWILSYFGGSVKGVQSNATSLINPGSMCEGHMLTERIVRSPSNATENFESQRSGINIANNLSLDIDAYSDGLLNTALTWGKFWSLEKVLLVEKSPHAMLKRNLLRAAFSNSKSIKFIVVIKHPVTLNVALKRGFQWMTKKEKRTRDRKPSYGLESADLSEEKIFIDIELSSKEVEENAKYFIHFMTHKKVGAGSRCTLGWLNAMDQLLIDLKTEPNGAQDTKIVRLESFTRPYPICQSIFRFVHDSYNSSEYMLAEEKVCQTHFQRVQKNNHVSTRKQSIDPLNRGSRFGINLNEGIVGIGQQQIGRQGQERRQGPDGVDLPQYNRHNNQESKKSINSGRSVRNTHVGVIDTKQKKYSTSGRNKNGTVGTERGSRSLRQQTQNHQYQSTESSFLGNEIRKNESSSRINHSENQFNNVSIVDRNIRRKLRLKWSENPKEKKNLNLLEFIPEILSASIDDRIKQYHIAYNLLPLQIQSELDLINSRLKKFGYSLEKGKERWSKYSKSAFDPWT